MSNQEQLPIVRYLPASQAAAYLEIGWVAHPSFISVSYGQNSVVVEWPREKGEPVFPEGEEKK